jgi:hypothetical protein
MGGGNVERQHFLRDKSNYISFLSSYSVISVLYCATDESRHGIRINLHTEVTSVPHFQLSFVGDQNSAGDLI